MPITFTKQFLIAGSLLGLIFTTTVILPRTVEAFWPFSTNADAATNAVVPSSSTPVLVAPTNWNPNTSAFDSVPSSGDMALISYSGPSGTIADVASSTPPDRISVYVVRSGDTLPIIAKLFNVSPNTIVWANNLSSTKDIHVGQTLIILPISGVKRVVARGDTFNSLAKKFGADANEIAQFNGLDPAEPLAVGSTVIIPGGEFSTPTTVVKKTTRKVSGKLLKEPFLGGSGEVQAGYYSNPVPGALITQGIHGWNGIDLGAHKGTPVHAAADGSVIIAKNGGWNGGYGNYIVITHANGSQTLYAHLTNAIVSPGQSVSSGQVIGYSGSTGKSTGAHLHFEVRGAANPFRNCAVNTVCSPQ